MGTGEYKISQGLCSSCRNVDICLYRKSQSSDPQFCEMYEADGTVEHPLSELSSSENKLVGLCVNCERRTTCLLPKPAGGVWRCQEYS